MSRREKKEETVEIGAANGTPLAEELLERINWRAYELYQLRGEVHGHHEEDWLEAERQIRRETMVRSRERD
jgi:hypothetical protein